MVAETWILKMGNQVSQNLKTALQIEQKKKKKKPDQKAHKQILGILSFEVANVMSKTIHLHNSLTDQELVKLRYEVLKSDGVLNLVSADESYLLELAMAEKLEDLSRIASIVSRLGNKCNAPALHGFRHVYDDLINGAISVAELGFLVKDMESMVRKMERYVNGTSGLYCELEVLSELEHASKKFQLNQHEESRRAFQQKLIWHRQEIRHLKSVSLWNQTYDKTVELLARTVCTIYARIVAVFGESVSRRDSFGLSDGGSSSIVNVESSKFSGQVDVRNYNPIPSGPLNPPSSLAKSYSCNSGSLEKAMTSEKKGVMVKSKHDLRRREALLFHAEEFIFPCVTSPGKIFLECLSLTSSGSKVDDGDDEVADQDERFSETSGCCSVNGPISKRDYPNHSSCFSRSEISVSCNGDQRKGRVFSSRFSPRNKLCTTLQAPPSTVGGSALSLHYANVIIIVEKLLRYPHLVGEEARDDLYQMLPTSLRLSLKTNLKSYVKNVAIYDAPLAHVWKDNLDSILRWLAPLAHNMIRWQSERSFEQHEQIVTRTNVLLLQTLHFADRQKTEAAICELLVGLNYICRYEHQQNALMDCASSFDLEDCMEWQMQSSSYLH